MDRLASRHQPNKLVTRRYFLSVPSRANPKLNPPTVAVAYEVAFSSLDPLPEADLDCWWGGRLDPLTTLGLCVRVCACVTAQWTGIVTQIAVDMLESGKVDAVVCVQSDENDRFTPKPVVARTAADIVAAKGVKPSLSPNLNVLATIEALVDVKKLLFIGVG
eukprot:9166320-Pyramimonas_sp.AAC.1